MRSRQLLYLIIFLEGFMVLGAELTAIRQLVPFVGGTTDIVSVVIAAVLVPLAFGYEAGGRFRQHTKGGQRMTLRKKLLRNITAAAIVFALGLSYVTMEIFFSGLVHMGLMHPLLQCILYCALFLVAPVYLLGQTIPLMMHYFPKANRAKTTGLVLFFSTVGSFLGSVLSTLVIMPFFGVNSVVMVLCAITMLMVFLLLKHKLDFYIILAGMFFAVAVFLNSPGMMAAFHIAHNNQYNTSMIVPGDLGQSRVLALNRSISAKFAENPDLRFDYIKYAEDQFIEPIADGKEPPRSILVIGAGGFTFGLNDRHNHYTYVDIDRDLKKVAEEKFLKRKLGPNKHFAAKDARVFVRQAAEKYDLIFLDAYTNLHNIPAQLITQEFFRDVKSLLTPGGRVVFNAISSPTLGDRYSTGINATFSSVFPNVTRQVVQPFDAWRNKPANILYIYYNDAPQVAPYTDNKNPFFYDMQK